MHIHLNGRLTEVDKAAVSPLDRGFTLGDGLFETVAIRGGAPRFLDAHLGRLFAGLETIGITAPWPGAAIAEAVAEVIAANGVDEGVARITVTRGRAPRGLAPSPESRPTLTVTAAAMAPRRAPTALVVVAGTRRNEWSPLSRIKSLCYLDGILALDEAQRRGADDGLMLNTRGQVAEATAANLFAVLDGVALTPPVTDGALPGVMRAAVLARTESHERSITLSDLETASEIFLTNSLGIRPVVSLDGKPVGGEKPGPLATALIEALA
jgi:branched-chain amino acid aminotransferase